MITIVLLVAVAYLFGKRRLNANYREYSVYYCDIHQGHFTLPGNAPYAHCPSCKGTFDSMEHDVMGTIQ